MPPLVDINLAAVFGAAIASIVLGFLWYGPLFGKQWMSLMGWKKLSKAQMEKMKKGAQKSYVLGFVSALVMAYVLAHFVDYVGATTFLDGAITGFWVWLGFVATVMLGMVLWDGKPWKLYYINIGYQLVNLLVMGALLAVWV